MNIAEFEKKIEEILVFKKPQKELTFEDMTSEELKKNESAWIVYNSLLNEYGLLGKMLIILRQFITSKEIDNNWYDIVSAFQYANKNTDFEYYF